jgi:hypothetical protein
MLMPIFFQILFFYKNILRANLIEVGSIVCLIFLLYLSTFLVVKRGL